MMGGIVNGILVETERNQTVGAWSTSITGNDTAQDLRAEYACAFYYYKDVSEAVQKIEEYVASYGINESDPEEYCDYVYSLADFMWKKGILMMRIPISFRQWEMILS